MGDSPSAPDLLEAVARILGEEVRPATEGATRHAVRVAANLCLIVARELGAPAGDDIDSSLAVLLGARPDDDLATLLDDRLRLDDVEFDRSVFDVLLADVGRRVDIASPGYRDPST